MQSRQLVVYLRFDVEYSHEAGGVDLTYRIQLGAVHRVLVRAVLQVLIGGNVGHHLLVSYKEVVAAVLLVLLGRPSRVCHSQ